MHRVMVYPYEGIQDVDILNTNKNTMVALGYAMQAILGTGTYIDGLLCTPTSPASLGVTVSTGSIYSLAAIDATAYGSLAADTTDQIVKQGIAVGATAFTLTPPATSGQSVVYIIQAQYQDIDGGSTNEPFINSTTGAPYSSTVTTVRQGKCILSLKEGTIATTGSQTTPAPDAGYTALWAITVANGATTITSGNIAQVAGAPFIVNKLTGLLAAANNLSDVASASTALANLGGLAITAARMKLTGNYTYYVALSGNDANNGSFGAPWLTLQHAWNFIVTNIDLGGNNVTIQVENGTYTTGLNSSVPWTGSGTVTLQGNISSPASCVISTTSNDAIEVSNGANLNIAGGFTIQTTTGGNGIHCQGSGSYVSITGAMNYGACAGIQLYANGGGIINVSANYTVIGGAQVHMQSNGGQLGFGAALTATCIGGAISFTNAFATATNLGLMIVSNATFSGWSLVAAQKYAITANGVINTNGAGAGYLPGNSAGIAASGGQYI